MINFEEEIKNVKKLPTISGVIARLSALVASRNSTIDEIVDVINYDQSLTSNIIKWVNSPLWGGAKEISDIKEAVIRLGPGRILKIVVGETVKPAMLAEVEKYGLVKEELWRHTVASAAAAEELQKHVKVSLPPESFTAALLHDVGKVVIAELVDEDTFNQIIDLNNSGKYSFIQAERKVLGIGHPKVGWLVAKSWNFPENVAQAILYHHDPDKKPDVVNDVVHLANIAAKTLGIGIGNEELNVFGSAKSGERLGLKPKGFEILLSDVLVKMTDIEKSFK